MTANSITIRINSIIRIGINDISGEKWIVESGYSIWTGSGFGLMRGHNPLVAKPRAGLSLENKASWHNYSLRQ